jgi:hypothetical protein
MKRSEDSPYRGRSVQENASDTQLDRLVDGVWSQLWPEQEPAPDFLAKVSSAVEKLGSDSPPVASPTEIRPEVPRSAEVRSLRRLLKSAAFVALGAAAATALLRVGANRPPNAHEESHSLTERTALAFGGRAVAVAEQGTELRWRSVQNGVSVTLSQGDVFFRVERGGPFTVDTPAGTVEVTGTCFRVEVTPMRPAVKNLVAALGGAAAATVVVTVFEGSVLFGNSSGQVKLAAGEGARANHAEQSPQRLPGRTPTIGLIAQIPGDATQRERVQQQTIVALEEKVAGLTRELQVAQRQVLEGEPDKDGINRGKFLDLTKEELAILAKRCEVRYDIPPHAMEAGYQLSSGRAERFGLSEGEREVVNQALRDEGQKVEAEIRSIYAAATGDKTGAEKMRLQEMQEAVLRKDRGELNRAQQRLAQERAGQIASPTASEQRPYAERMLRALIASGDSWEAQLGRIFGPERARDMRRRHVTYTGRRSQAGCPESSSR